MAGFSATRQRPGPPVHALTEARATGAQDPAARKVCEVQRKRLNLAYEAIQKARQGR